MSKFWLSGLLLGCASCCDTSDYGYRFENKSDQVVCVVVFTPRGDYAGERRVALRPGWAIFPQEFDKVTLEPCLP